MTDSKKMGSILPIKRTKLSDQVVQVIQNYIARNKLKRGDRLPSEQELSRTLNVGTRSIREGLRSLEARGVVSIHQGKGVFVDEKYRADFIRFIADSLELTVTRDQSLLVELAYVRKIIETSVIADVAASHDEETVDQLEGLITVLLSAKKTKNLDEYNRVDVMFHKKIIEATKNRILIAIYDRLTDLLVESFTKTGYAHGAPERSFKEHREMVDSIRVGDPDRARSVMTRQLEHSMSTLSSHISAGTM